MNPEHTIVGHNPSTVVYTLEWDGETLTETGETQVSCGGSIAYYECRCGREFLSIDAANDHVTETKTSDL